MMELTLMMGITLVGLVLILGWQVLRDRRRDTRTARDLQRLVDAMESPRPDPNIPATSPHPDVVERLEVLERRMESLHNEALKHLKRGSTALARAEQLRATVEGEDLDDVTDEQLAEGLASLGSEQPTNESEPNEVSLDDVISRIRARG